MVKKKDLMKIFFVYVCLCHVCPAHPCGDNPLRNIIFIAEKTGRPLYSVLQTLRIIDERAYKHLQTVFDSYAQCVGMVDTGYFKRSQPPTFTSGSEEDLPLEEIAQLLEENDKKTKSDSSRRLNVLKQLLHDTGALLNKRDYAPS